MTMNDSFFADTYALVEITKGSTSYEKYALKNLVTTKYNLAELYYSMLREFNEETAAAYFSFLWKITIHTSRTSIKEGMKFKLQYKKEKLSYVDCIGYSLAQELKIPFLTGDSKFKDKENVAWVK